MATTNLMHNHSGELENITCLYEITRGLKECGGSQTRTAKLLDSSLRIINYKIYKYGIDPQLYKVGKLPAQQRP